MKRNTPIDRKEQIVNEAISIIHEHGYSALSIRELSRRVGISEPAIYRHFQSKEDIIMGILDRMAFFGEHIKKNLSDVANNNEKIKRFVTLQFEFLEKNPEMTSILFSDDIFEHNERLEKRLYQVMSQRWDIIRRIFDDLKKECTNLVQNTEDLCLILLGIIRMTVLEWRRSDYSYSLKERGKRVMDTLEQIGFFSKGSAA